MVVNPVYPSQVLVEVYGYRMSADVPSCKEETLNQIRELTEQGLHYAGYFPISYEDGYINRMMIFERA